MCQMQDKLRLCLYSGVQNSQFQWNMRQIGYSNMFSVVNGDTLQIQDKEIGVIWYMGKDFN